MKTKVFHNHEIKLIRDKLSCYRTEIKDVGESPRFYILQGKIELCCELLQSA